MKQSQIIKLIGGEENSVDCLIELAIKLIISHYTSSQGLCTMFNCNQGVIKFRKISTKEEDL